VCSTLGSQVSLGAAMGLAGCPGAVGSPPGDSSRPDVPSLRAARLGQRRGCAAKPALYRSLQKQTLNLNLRRRLLGDVPFGAAIEGLTAADLAYRARGCPAGRRQQTAGAWASWRRWPRRRPSRRGVPAGREVPGGLSAISAGRRRAWDLIGLVAVLTGAATRPMCIRRIRRQEGRAGAVVGSGQAEAGVPLFALGHGQRVWRGLRELVCGCGRRLRRGWPPARGPDRAGRESGSPARPGGA
jgi:hypothetical protein